MKIYPNNGNIILTDKVNMLTDIPLGYIDSLTREYDISINKKIYPSGVRVVIPYETFSSYNYKFFKQVQKNNFDPSNFSEIDNEVVLKRVENKYQYVPNAELSFVPLTFEYSVIGKKTLKYNAASTYNLKIGCAEANDKLLSKSLIKIFGDASDKGLCPENIRINNKDLMQESLLNGSIADLDFVFVQSKKGDTYIDTEINIPYEEYLSSHTNMWLCIDTLTPLLNTQINYKEPIIYNNSNNKLIATNNIFEKATFQENYLPPPTKEILLFDHTTQTPIIVKEYKDKGHIIISTTDFIKQSKENYKLIYETLLYIYLNAYIENAPITQWICDKQPDYVVKNGQLSVENDFKSLKKYYELLGFNNPSDVSLININISTSHVKIKSISNDYVLFEKISNMDNADPQKPEGCISIYTPRQDIVFIKDFIYIVEEDLDKKWIVEKTDTSYIIRLDSFKHSSANLNLTSAYTYSVTIPLIQTENYKEIQIEHGEFNIVATNNMLIAERATDNVNNERTGSNIIAKAIITKKNSDTSIYDMRRRGGGLLEESDNNLNLLDIGHIYGRSYRKSGTIIFRLPTRLKEYDSIIRNVIEDHIVAEKYFIIIYE